MNHPERWKNLLARYQPERPRRMLALDGGGIRGLITLGILEQIEALVARKPGDKLSDYFDYIAGTSTGAIIAAGLARGMTVAELVDFYRSSGKQMFEHSRGTCKIRPQAAEAGETACPTDGNIGLARVAQAVSPALVEFCKYLSSLIERVKYFYTADPLKARLQVVFGSDTNLMPHTPEPYNLKCLLLVVTKNVTTDSPWPISSNPEARYNDPARQNCNLASACAFS